MTVQKFKSVCMQKQRSWNLISCGSFRSFQIRYLRVPLQHNRVFKIQQIHCFKSFKILISKIMGLCSTQTLCAFVIKDRFLSENRSTVPRCVAFRNRRKKGENATATVMDLGFRFSVALCPFNVKTDHIVLQKKRKVNTPEMKGKTILGQITIHHCKECFPGQKNVLQNVYPSFVFRLNEVPEC